MRYCVALGGERGEVLLIAALVAPMALAYVYSNLIV